MEHWKDRALRSAEAPIRGYAAPPLKQLECDRWIASSTLQKAIRRGDTEIAQGAALTLHAHDHSAVWTRLIAIAFEDVGPADVALLVETVAIATASEWRARHEDIRVLLYLTQRLAEAPKDRSADYLMWVANAHPKLEQARQLCASVSMGERSGILAKASLPIPERAVAAWFCSGIDFPYERRVGPGDLQGLADLYRALGAPAGLTAATVLAAKRAREPYSVLVPLTWLEVQRNRPVAVEEQTLPRTEIVAGVPLCALDEHTRLGKRAINRLVQENASIRACLTGFVPRRRWTAAAQHSVFYAEGTAVSRRLKWSQSRSLEALGIESELSTAEVPPEGVEPLMAAIRGALDQLNEIRRDIFLAARAAGEA